jgi:YidC/Oxa1 family membrane protein insertase
MARNTSDDTMADPILRQQKMLLYVLPVVFGVGGMVFPIGVLIYWTVSNLWTLTQQSLILKREAGPARAV